ncbi:transcriptional regulator [Brevibacillus brevis]|uniref:transcriptional regulator n=1 Tax=Brevibacillus brevis TaxID=1393 RepID=UPI00165DB0B7|nr:transcriptional regulator [Brevibacillus brevis]
MAQVERRVSESVRVVLEKGGFARRKIAADLGFQPTVFDRWINGTRPFPLKELISTTEYLGLDTDYFFGDYLLDCWYAPKDKSERVRDFLCYTRTEGFRMYSDKLVNMLLEEGKQLRSLYETGLYLDEKGLCEEAEYFYTLVIDNERDRLAEHLALSYYRRFMIVRDWDMDYAFEAATKLSEHIRTLPEDVMFEAYTNIMTVFYVLDKWDHLKKYGEEARTLMERASTRNINLYAKCLSYLGFAYRNKQEFDKALDTHRLCGELGATFKVWDELNTCVVLLEAGDHGKLNELIELIHRFPMEAINHLEHIFQALLKNGDFLQIGKIISEFHPIILELFEKTDPYNLKRAIRVRLFIAESYVHFANYTAAKSILQTALSLARKKKLFNLYDDCMRVFWLLEDIKNEKFCSGCKKDIQEDVRGLTTNHHHYPFD